MRVIGGKYRHRLLVWPDDNVHIRPTKDRIREAIFSCLGNIDNFNVLDLYAGSGSLGIEALSRGASYCLFNDINKVALQTIKKNTSSLLLDSSTYDIFPFMDITTISRCNEQGKRFNLIFLDPPYKEGKYEEIISLILNNNLLKEHGILVVESERIVDFSFLEHFLIKEYNYGEIRVYVLRRQE